MSEFMFGVHACDERLPEVERDRRDAVASRHGCTWVEIREPTGQWKSWFVTRNRGFPFDNHVESAVLADIKGGSDG